MDNQDSAASVVRSDALLVALDQCRDTNRKLNRKLQELESKLKKNDLYCMGFQRGWQAGCETARKQGEKDLAAYKTATRKEMARLRATNAANEPRSDSK
jgi:hypothetical protein